MSIIGQTQINMELIPPYDEAVVKATKIAIKNEGAKALAGAQLRAYYITASHVF
jgi:hypothetical protein